MVRRLQFAEYVEAGEQDARSESSGTNMMWIDVPQCFLCDHLAKWRIPLYVWDKYGFLKASTEESLQVCQDCCRRVQQTEYDTERKVHVVTLRSLT